eukprot:m.480630 g.480630  ORF g.480630 m.480630 type:complete len:51 (-) comp21708_c0_seq3:19-171(-)
MLVFEVFALGGMYAHKLLLCMPSTLCQCGRIQHLRESCDGAPVQHGSADM